MAKTPKSKNLIKPLLILIVILFVLLIFDLSGVFEKRNIDTTTTTIGTTIPTTILTTIQTTIEKTSTITTSIPFVEHECKYLGYKIKSYSYENETLTFYLKNTGSIHIYNFVIILAYPNNIMEKAFYNVDIEPKEIEKFTTNVLTGLDNVTVYIPGCTYNIIDHLFNV
jgi:hypothetical protein